MASQEWSVAEAARQADISYRQMFRLLTGESRYIKTGTIDKLAALGIDRRALVLAAYGEAVG